MGYYILGAIIFLLLIVFISDLLRNSKDNKTDEFDNDEFYNRLSSQYPGTFAYKEEFSEELDEKEDERSIMDSVVLNDEMPDNREDDEENLRR